jgi:hypothetical protein
VNYVAGVEWIFEDSGGVIRIVNDRGQLSGSINRN